MVYLLFIIIMLAILKSLKEKTLKSRKRYNRARLKAKKFVQVVYDNSEVKSLKLELKEKVWLDQTLTRIRVNAPRLLSKNINLEVLSGIDLSKPIFIFEDEERKKLKSFLLAKKFEAFTLIFISNKNFKNKPKELIFIQKNIDNLEIILNLEKLNINYKQEKRNKISVVHHEKKFNNLVLEMSFEENGFCVKAQKIFLGERFVKTSIFNKNNKNGRFCFDFFDFLSKNIYFFDYGNKNIHVADVINKEEKYYYFSNKINEVSFSANEYSYSKEPCVFSKINVFLKAGEEKILYIFILNSEKKKIDFSKIFEIKSDELKEIFGTKVYSGNRKIDYYFNSFLPRMSVLENSYLYKEKKEILSLDIFDIIELHKEKKLTAFDAYMHIKNKFLIKAKECVTFKNPLGKNFALEMFFEGVKKRVEVCEGEQNKLVVNGMEYLSVNSISFSQLKKSELKVFIQNVRDF